MNQVCRLPSFHVVNEGDNLSTKGAARADMGGYQLGWS